MIGRNDEYRLFIDISPTSAQPVYAELGAGISDISKDTEENIQSPSLLGDGGFATSVTVGGQVIVRIKGVRIYGDAAQDFIFSDAVRDCFRAARTSTARLIYPDGSELCGGCTLAKITQTGGSAGTTEGIYIELRFNGKPLFSAPTESTEGGASNAD